MLYLAGSLRVASTRCDLRGAPGVSWRRQTAECVRRRWDARIACSVGGMRCVRGRGVARTRCGGIVAELPRILPRMADCPMDKENTCGLHAHWRGAVRHEDGQSGRCSFFCHFSGRRQKKSKFWGRPPGGHPETTTLPAGFSAYVCLAGRQNEPHQVTGEKARSWTKYGKLLTEYSKHLPKSL